MSKKRQGKEKSDQSPPSSQQLPATNPLSDLSQTQEKAGEKAQTPPQLVETWLNQTKAPQQIKNAWENILTRLAQPLDKNSTSHPQDPQSFQKILQRLDSIEKQVQKQGAKPTYAQTVQKTIGQEIPVPTRIHNEVTIRPELQTGQLANRTPAQLMEALKNQAPLSCQKDIRAVRKLPSGDIIISLETPQAKAQLESNKEWISTVFTAEAKLSPRIFPVLVHGVQTKDFKPENLEETKRAIFSQNFGMESKVTILKVYWSRKAKLLQKPVTSLHLDLATPEQANLLIEKGVVLGYTLHEVEPALLTTSVVQCYKCARFGHQARTCQASAQCTACGGTHARRDCQASPETLVPKCANCKGKHPAWSKSCQKKQEAIQRAREAWLARPGRYTTVPTTIPSQNTPREEMGPSLQVRQEPKKRKQGEVLGTRSSSRLNTQSSIFSLPQTPEFQVNMPKKKTMEIFENSSQEV